jgi:alpha-tubulin suppressor-like RCC1 family protein
MFAHQPAITPKVIAVSCGTFHILVVARDLESSHGNLYTSGFNSHGQLGHGDTVNRDVLTLVRYNSNCYDSFL